MDAQLYLLDRQIRIFGASIAYLAKVGRDIVLEVENDQVSRKKFANLHLICLY